MIGISVIILGMAGVAGSQDLSGHSPASERVVDSSLGISFDSVGRIEKRDGSYLVTFVSTAGTPIKSTFAEMSVSDRPFVDLPGSYGGRLYFDRPDAKRWLSNMVLTDSIVSGQLKFRREYWTVYSGMGAWEGVINCYAKVKDRYYVLSLTRDKRLGKPGEVVNGRPLSAAGLKEALLAGMRDTSDVEVQAFNKLLTSVKIQY